jgi:hypothetical protein
MSESQRQRNRELMPNVAAMIDEWKIHFPGLKVIWAIDHETGHEVGKKEEPDPSKVFVIPPDYFPCTQVETPKKGRKK